MEIFFTNIVENENHKQSKKNKTKIFNMYKRKKQKIENTRTNGKYIKTTHENKNCKTPENNISRKPKKEEEMKRIKQIFFSNDRK